MPVGIPNTSSKRKMSQASTKGQLVSSRRSSAEEVPVGNRIVKDRRVCHSCKGFIGRKGVELVDEETMREEKLEANKRNNRQSAARSNLERKEREELQRTELELKKQMVVSLSARQVELREENEFLQRCALERGINLPYNYPR